MLKPALDFGKQVASLVHDVQQSKADIKVLQQDVKDLRQGLKETQQELRELSHFVQQLAFQVQRNADNERHEREKMALRMEITLLRIQQGLPPAPPNALENDS